MMMMLLLLLVEGRKMMLLVGVRVDVTGVRVRHPGVEILIEPRVRVMVVVVVVVVLLRQFVRRPVDRLVDELLPLRVIQIRGLHDELLRLVVRRGAVVARCVGVLVVGFMVGVEALRPLLVVVYASGSGSGLGHLGGGGVGGLLALLPRRGRGPAVARPLLVAHANLLSLAGLGIAVELGLLKAHLDELRLDVRRLPVERLLGPVHFLIQEAKDLVVAVFFPAAVGAQKSLLLRLWQTC